MLFIGCDECVPGEHVVTRLECGCRYSIRTLSSSRLTPIYNAPSDLLFDHVSAEA